jgi:hypothetical protein
MCNPERNSCKMTIRDMAMDMTDENKSANSQFIA